MEKYDKEENVVLHKADFNQSVRLFILIFIDISYNLHDQIIYLKKPKVIV